MALVLWKFLRTCRTFVSAGGAAFASHPTEKTVNTYNKVIRLAKELGVKDEFFKILFAFPVMEIRVKEFGVAFAEEEVVNVRIEPEEVEEARRQEDGGIQSLPGELEEGEGTPH